MRAYLGIPLIVANGAALGALTALDFQPRPWTEEQIAALQILARQVVSQLELRLLHREQTELLLTQAKTERDLRASEARYRNVVENSHDLIWAADAEGHITFINMASQTICGYRPDEMIGRYIYEFMPPEDRAKNLAAFAHTVRSGRDMLDYQSRLTGKDGRTLTVRTNAVVQRNAAGKVVGATGIARDVTRQLRTEETLRENQTLLRIAGQMAHVGGWRLSVYPRLHISWSDEACAIYDLPAGASLGLNEALGYFTRPWRQLVRQAVTTCIEQGKPFELEPEIITAQGRRASLRIIGQPVFNADGAVTQIQGAVQDITELVHATEQLRTSEAQYRLLFVSNPHPMWVYDRTTLRILDVNDAAVRHYGYTRDEFLAMTIRDIRPPDDVTKIEEHVASLTAEPSFGVWRHLKRDGTPIDVEISSDSLEFNGRPARLVMAADITARRQAEARLRQQAALLDIAHDAIIVRDLNDRITFWNQGAQRIYGYQAEEVVGRSLVDVLHPDATAYATAKAKLLDVGVWSGEITKRHRAGRDIIVEASWTLVYADTGTPSAILSINTNITERKHLEAQILRSQRLESIGTLAGGIAHDLNNVLAPILLAIDMLRQRVSGDKEQHILDMLEQNARRGAGMVRQVLAFARGVEGERVQVDLARSIDDLEQLVRDTFDRRITVVKQIDQNLWPVTGDPTQLHQILLNLCVNARDAMPGGGTLELLAANITVDAQYASMNPQAEPGNYVKLTVADSGSGIPASILGRIFDPFFTTKPVGSGTGLGLATVQGVVKSHGGFVNVYSEQGRGTVFHVYLPAASTQAVPAPQPSNTEPIHGAGELILVVDDEKTVRTVIQQTLESYNYRVLIAEDGASALSLYVQHGADVAAVLTDMMMPIMDGYAFIKALYKIDPAVKIIAASGLAANGMVTQAADAGVQHFLHKPYTAAAMLGKLAEVLDKR